MTVVMTVHDEYFYLACSYCYHLTSTTTSTTTILVIIIIIIIILINCYYSAFIEKAVSGSWLPEMDGFVLYPTMIDIRF